MNPIIKLAPDFQYRPSAKFRFFLSDPAGNGLTYYWSKEKRDSAANEAIQNYLDDSWSEEVEWVCAGEVTHVAQVLNKTFPPPSSELDEYGCDGDGYHWGDVAWRGNYTLEPLPEPMLLDSNGNRSIFDDVDK